MSGFVIVVLLILLFWVVQIVVTWRGGKYKADITPYTVDANEYDDNSKLSAL